ncbi:MAG TPA: FtsX-like permease family protein, partial [Gemmatimonadaceae bacterium]|nr:FtsX-like permease family protein [Gemmatimonadaceae bacterium]
ALAGASLGLLLALWAVSALRAAAPAFLPRLAEIELDARVVLFTVALALLTGVLFGLAPALRAGRRQLADTIRDGARGTGAAGAARLRASLVLAEVALALVLLVGAGLLVRSFDRLQRVSPGFDPRGVLTMRVILPPARYGDAHVERARQFTAQLLEQARALPGVRTASVSSTLPMAGAPYNTFFVYGRQLPAPGTMQDAQRFIATADYFRVMGVRLVRGRLFTERDDAGAPGVVVINETMARRYWPGESPLGARITFGDPTDSATTRYTVVGVVNDVKQEGLSADAYAQLYQPFAQAPRLALHVAARTSGDPLQAAAALRRIVRALDPTLPVAEIRTMEDRVRESVAQPRVSVALLGGFSAVALLLAAVGIYGVMAYAVAQRTREIGIRVALGARPTDVRRLVVRQGMTPALLGVAVGLAGAFAVTRLMASLLFDVSATDPLTFAAVSAFLLSVALVASWLPARRATRVDPLLAMRSE